MLRVNRTVSLAAVVLCAGAARADTGDQLHRLLPSDGASMGDPSCGVPDGQVTPADLSSTPTSGQKHWL